jgi:hypothetical protein
MHARWLVDAVNNNTPCLTVSGRVIAFDLQIARGD